MEKVICGFPCEKLQLPGLNGRGYSHALRNSRLFIGAAITVGTILCVLISEILFDFRKKERRCRQNDAEKKLIARMQEIISDPVNPMLAAAVGVIKNGEIVR